MVSYADAQSPSCIFLSVFRASPLFNAFQTLLLTPKYGNWKKYQLLWYQTSFSLAVSESGYALVSSNELLIRPRQAREKPSRLHGCFCFWLFFLWVLVWYPDLRSKRVEKHRSQRNRTTFQSIIVSLREISWKRIFYPYIDITLPAKQRREILFETQTMIRIKFLTCVLLS